MNNIYMQNILDHFHNPENNGVLEDPDLVYEEYNSLCGDKIKVFLKLNSLDVVEKAQFIGEGCAISQASISMLTTEIVGKSKKDILALDKDFVIELLGIELSPTRLKCALLGLEALKKAVLQ